MFSGLLTSDMISGNEFTMSVVLYLIVFSSLILQVELRCMSQIGARMKEQDLNFERLDITSDKAEEMFIDNEYKLNQIPSITSKSRSGSHLTVYRLGEHIDISRGPMIASTTFLNRFDITAVSYYGEF